MSEDSLSEERVFRTGEIVAGKFVIAELIGRGGMGSVYRAFNSTLQQDVALKIIHPHLIGAPQFKSRFLREARALAAVGDDNLVRIYSFGPTDDGLLYMALEYLPGETLQGLLEREGALPAPRAVRFALQICRGMAKAHEVGVVHRDLKPANICITEQNQVKVLDFGIATNVASSEQALTATGSIIGSPAYMSPEQCKGLEVDFRSDIYSLGCVLYEMLCGRSPFQAETALASMSEHLDKSLTAVPAPSAIPLKLQAIVLQCLAKDPARRFATMSELSEELLAVDWDSSQVTTPPRPPSKLKFMVRTVAAACVVFALLLTGLLLVSNAKSVRPVPGTVAKVLAKGSGPRIDENRPAKNLMGRTELQEKMPHPLQRVAYYQNWLSKNEQFDKLRALEAYRSIYLDYRKSRPVDREKLGATRERIIELCGQLLADNPKKIGSRNYLKAARDKGDMLEDKGSFSEAIDVLNVALTRVGDDACDRDVAETKLRIADNLIKLNDKAGAERLLRNVVETIEQHRMNSKMISNALVKLSNLLHQSGKGAEAVTLLEAAEAKIAWQKQMSRIDYESRGSFLSRIAEELNDKSHFTEAARLYLAAADTYLQSERKQNRGIEDLQLAAMAFQSAGQSKLAEKTFSEALSVANDSGAEAERWQIIVSMIRNESEQQRADGSIAKLVQQQLECERGRGSTNEGKLRGLLDVCKAATCCGDEITASRALRIDSDMIFNSHMKDEMAFNAIIPVCSQALSLKKIELAKALLVEHKKRLAVVSVDDPELQETSEKIQEAILLSLECSSASVAKTSVEETLAQAMAMAQSENIPELALDVINARVACCSSTLSAADYLDMATVAESYANRTHHRSSLNQSKVLGTLVTLMNGAFVRGLDSVGRELLKQATGLSKSTGETLLTVDSIHSTVADVYVKKGDFSRASDSYERAIKSRDLVKYKMERGHYATMLKNYAFACERSGKSEKARRLLREAKSLT
ncbi:MAG: serine/threonine protein kinase [Candidatus Obscuribacterales bacterium]|nr:serine/threonine protein kinase [Candidatus Obscuribacterales bacterium]